MGNIKNGADKSLVPFVVKGNNCRVSDKVGAYAISILEIAPK
ncbi:MAG: hypothetical protein PHU14_04310 [Methylovulum sp.]|nr:hypothetical protein [Methylovulum sp.]